MPTSSANPDRIGSLDLIRGVAIQGILLANIPWFSGTGATSLVSTSPPEHTFAGQVVKALTLAFVDSKFITQLAILFGAGIALQADRAWSADRRFTWGYLWRTALLFLLGALHAFLLWFGDILMIYACVSAAVVLFVRLSTKGLLCVAVAGLTWTAVCLAVGIVLSQGADERPAKENEKPPPDAIATSATLSESISRFMQAPPELREEKQKGVEKEFKIYFSRNNQIRIYREGTFGEQLFDRALNGLFLVLALIFTFGELGACFLFGAILVRGGFFSDPEVYSRWRPWMLVGGLCLGIPMQVAALILTFAGERNEMVASLTQLCAGIGIALVYLTLLTGWAQSHRVEWLQARLKAVGRLALTNYLSQTVICTTIFYSFGFGLYATLGRPATLLVVLGVWIVQLIVSPLYLCVFSIGPVEWVWRSLSQGRLLPLRKGIPIVTDSNAAKDIIGDDPDGIAK